MARSKRRLNLVIDLLTNEADRLTDEIKKEKGKSKDKIELKEQILDAIGNLNLFVDYDIFAKDISIVKIPEGGSDAHFTEFNLVDEGGIENTQEWAIKKNEKGEIKLNCFDLIIKKVTIG